jgi:1,2-diacylglycerol 3-beta-galactosyltransferase
MLAPFHSIIRRSHDRQVELLVEHWRTSRPDAVISFIPHFNECVHEAMSIALPGVPLITVMTDLADYPPNFWIGERQPQYFICGTARAREQALAAGHPVDHVFETSGMVLNPRFHRQSTAVDGMSLQALGLRGGRPTAMMMFGGEGSSDMVTIARNLDASGLDLQLIALCGNNAKLERRLRHMWLRMPMHITGFTSEVASLMRLCDFFIGKPGPASISEALTMGLPVIVERNRWTMPQERYNAEWIEERGMGIAIGSFRRDIAAAAAAMLDPARRRGFAGQIAGYRNRAIFEVSAIIDSVVRSRPHGKTRRNSAAGRGTVREAHPVPASRLVRG